MSDTYRFRRADYRRPPVQLSHVDVSLSFFDEAVDVRETLHVSPREPLCVVALDAQDLDIGRITLIAENGSEQALTSVVFKRKNRLEIVLPREYQAGEDIILSVHARCRPTPHILDGLYFDTTPPGAPPQIISQCQQWGFQRIAPIIDDCTAKCTWRTTLEGSARYTHLITNGDVCLETNPDGKPIPVPGDPSRMRITYVNRIPMPPYLFLAAAGTWDVLADTVSTHLGRTIRLEYLVPPGMSDGARIPMAILKDAVAWQARRLDYDYQRECYRTICMEKSNFGGMENVGNTTIITEAALIDAWTTDRRLIYAHGVIIHEFEHNQCGSDVTMETPFDMWLNEAYTVNIEREYVRERFGYDLMRLEERDAMRAPLNGPLAVEDAGVRGRIVREGFNDPDEVVDGVTYVKAPDVLEMLRALIGPERYEEAVATYFQTYAGGNAGTDQFLDVFQRVSPRDLGPFFSEWLFSNGYPAVTGTYVHDAGRKTLTVRLRQTRRGGSGGWFTVPLRIRGVSDDGAPMPAVDRLLVLDAEFADFVFEAVAEAPAFLDWNSEGAFYGTIVDATITPDGLVKTVRTSPFRVGRVEAMCRLTDMQMAAMIADPTADPDLEWLALFPACLDAPDLTDGIRARLLTLTEEMLDRNYLPLPVERNAAARRLRRRVAAHCGVDALRDALACASRVPAEEPMARAIPRRALCGALAVLLAETGADGQLAVEAYFDAGACVSDRIYAARALQAADAPHRQAVIARLGEFCRGHVGAYGAYLSVVASAPTADVFAAIAREASSPDFRMDHPGHSRALYGAMAANNAQLWTEAGLDWAVETLQKLAPVNTIVAMGVLAAFQLAPALREPLRGDVQRRLRRLAAALPSDRFPSLHARLQECLIEPSHP